MGRVYRHIKDGFKGVFRHFALSLSSISSVTVTLILMSIFLFLSVNLNEITHNIEQSVQIHVQIEPEYSTEEGIKELERRIADISDVMEVEFSSRDDELEAFIEANDSEDAEELYGVYRGEENPMLDAFLVTARSGKVIRAIAEKIDDFDGVFRTNYGGMGTANFLKMLEQIRNIGLIIVSILMVIAVFLISNTVRVSIHSRREEISIMRTVGATNWYIRWPFIIEGMIIGFIGSIVPVLISIFGYRYLYNTTGGQLFSNMFQLMEYNPLSYQISLLLTGIGVGVGALGSMFSVGRYLRWSR